SGFAHSLDETMAVAADLGFPVIVRPSFVLGGGGSGLAGGPDDLAGIAAEGLAASPISEVLVEESVAGWKEFELEVMRDAADNAARLAVGYTLDEIGNDITGRTLAAFEPALDYVAVKVPRWAFEKFPGADASLSTTMRSVGEVMGIGRTFAEALGKAHRALERPEFALGADGLPAQGSLDEVHEPLAALATATEHRLLLLERALADGHSIDAVAAA